MKKLRHLITNVSETDIWVDGILLPKNLINPKLIYEKIEGWTLSASFATHIEMLVPFAHEIAKARAPENANAYELLGHTQEVRGGYQRKIRYYQLNENAVEEVLQELNSSTRALANVASNLTRGYT